VRATGANQKYIWREMKVNNSGWIKDENWKYKREFYTSMILMSWLQVLYVYNRLRPRKLSRNKFGKENRKKKKKKTGLIRN
jgi:hypothetical protein